MKLHIHRPHPKSWFHRKSKAVVVPEVMASATVPAPAVVEPVVKVSRGMTIRQCNNAIDDAYKMYDKALQKADREYTDALQPINAAFYSVLRQPNSRDSTSLSDARKKYWLERTALEVIKQKAISSAGAVLDVEIKHQNELIDEA